MPEIDRIDFAYSLFADEYNKYGDEEIQAAVEVLQAGRLFFPLGRHVKRLEERLADDFGVRTCTLVTSGTAAVHTALGAVGVSYGDEVITSPITDTGTVLPILLQGAVPVFADVDPTTFSITAESIEPLITNRTKAIVVVHLGGYPADVVPIMKLAESNDIMLIEDCAQAPWAFVANRRLGTIGHIGAFSTNDTKHVSCGEGGFVVCRDAEVGRRAALFHDKGFDRASGIRNPALIGPNYRMTELQAAVLDKQWDKLPDRIARRTAFARRLDGVLSTVPWVSPRAALRPGDASSYFSYLFSVKPEAPTTREYVCDALCRRGVPARNGNLYDVQYRLDMFHQAKPGFLDQFPHPDYSTGLCPVAEATDDMTIRIEMLEIFDEKQVEAVKAVVCSLNQ